jgi:hypothetical protein
MKFVQNLKAKTITFCLGAILYSWGKKRKKKAKKTKRLGMLLKIQ